MDNDAKLISEAYDTSKGLHRDGKITVAQLKQEYNLQGDEQIRNQLNSLVLNR